MVFFFERKLKKKNGLNGYYLHDHDHLNSCVTNEKVRACIRCAFLRSLFFQIKVSSTKVILRTKMCANNRRLLILLSSMHILSKTRARMKAQ
jgi:hypothetical protein